MSAASCPKATPQELVAGLTVPTVGGGGGHSTWAGGGVSVVHMLLLTQERNTNFDFHDLCGGIVLSVVTGE